MIFHLYPLVLSQLETNTPLQMGGTGKPLRQFLYSKDVAKMILWAIDSYNDPSPIIFSVGEEDEITIKDVTEIIAEAMQFKGQIIFDSSIPDGQYKKTASNKKLLSLYPDFKYTPIRQAVKETVDWYIQNFETARK